ncbi:T9SS type A sorting domain-containing protein [bacterium]|nr:T9SS type A sorting domain-containing protein [bacterium]
MPDPFTSSSIRTLAGILLLLAVLLCVPATHAGFYPHVLVDGYHGTRAVYATDMDLDGDIDVLGAFRYDNLLGWWENDGSANWTEHIVADDFEGAWDVSAGDLNGDGYPEILGAAMTAGRVAVWENGPWTEHSIIDWFPYSKGITSADFDLDGDNDILACSYGYDRVSWFENGFGWDEHILTNTFYGARTVFAADIDQDGDPDILAGADSAGVWFWENNNNGQTWTRHQMPELLWGTRSVHAADIVGDNRLEIIAATSRFDLFVYWSQDGNGDWVSTVVADSIEFANDVYTGDMDGDGDLDIVGGTYSSDLLMWWENVDRDGTWIEHQISDRALGTRSVFVADLDGDNDNDIISACAHLQQVIWWENEPLIPLTLTVIPAHDPIIVPAQGDTVSFELEISSILNAPLTTFVWKDLRDPDGELILADDPDTVNVVTGDNSFDSNYTMDGDLDPGEYTLLIVIGEDRDNPIVSDSLQVTKSFDAAVRSNPSGQPRTYAVSPAYPNPFNGSTTLHVSLPVASDLIVTVTDILGRTVAEPIHGSFPAGSHPVTLNLHDHAAGIYLVRVAAAGQRRSLQRIVYLK